MIILVLAGFKPPLHLHPQPGIIFVLKGTLFHEISYGQFLTVCIGESFASSQNAFYYYKNNGDEEMVVINASAGAKDKKTTILTE